MARPGASGIEIEFGQATDPGLDPAKRVNEDSCGYADTKFGHLFVVCDGMGGHAGGKQASDIATRTIFEQIEAASDATEPGTALVRAIEEAARRVYAFGGPPTNLQRPGSTCVSILLHDGQVDICHVGDSRAYAIRGKQIYRLTRDHSMVQELLDGGMIDEHEAMGHPDSNKITRALGMTPEVQVERREEPMELYEGDVFVLASDGLTDLARNDDILVTVTEYLKERGIQAACNELVALANRRGGHDNITVQTVRVLDPGSSTVTRVQEPAALPGGRGAVSTTIEGTPVISPTVVQGPALEAPQAAPESSPLAITTPGAPAPAPPVAGPPVPSAPGPTVIDHGLVPQPLHPVPPLAAAPPLGPAMPPPAPPTTSELPDDEGAEQQPLLYLVLAMAGIIGLLLALLVWALYVR